MPTPTPGKRLALLVGIDCYPCFYPDSQLKSCANDVSLMAHVLLERFGFAEEDMVRLVNEAATREGILAGLAELRTRARAGDTVVFYYSGHGSQMRDREGDEPDGFDETIVPHDGGRPPLPGGEDITDDEIYAWILQTSEITPLITIIADTCSSGTIAREGPGVKRVKADKRSVTELPPSPVPPQLLPSKRRVTTPSGFLPASDRYVLLAACRSDEHAHELPPVPGVQRQSAFTFHLCRQLLAVPAAATYREVLDRTRLAMAAAGVPLQTPQVEGARDRVLFGSIETAPAPFLPVRSRTGERIVLGGGAVHGVGAGSTWAVYPADVRRSTEGGRPLGLVRVGEVRAVHSDALIIESSEDSEAITAGCRAFEREKGPGWLRLTVGFDTTKVSALETAELRRGIERSPVLALAEELGKANVEICLEATGWNARGSTGERALPPVPRQQAGAVARLVADLEIRVRYLNLLAVEDNGASNPLRGCLEVRLLRRSEGGDFQPAEPEAATGEIVYREGEPMAVEVLHHAAVPLQVHILDMGLTGCIDLFHPIPGDHELLNPGKPLQIGVRAGQGIRMRLPDAFAALAERAEGEPLEGREYLKVFATTHETDLAFLQQPGYGGTALASKQPRGGLGAALFRLVGGRSRESGMTTEKGWTVVTQEFLVRREGAQHD